MGGSPVRQVIVPPPTQIVPSASVEMCTRPARPSAVPWLATYGGRARPVSISHPASDALRLPVTGSSTVAPSFGKNARTSYAQSDPSGWAPTTPISMSIGPGRTASTAAASARTTATQPGPLSTH